MHLLMDFSILDRLEAAEAAGEELDAFETGDFSDEADGDLEPEQVGEAEEDPLDSEFSDFQNEDPELMSSFAQREHMGYAGAGRVGGQFSKLERIIQAQTESKESIYINKFRGELTNYFTDNQAAGYIQGITNISRYWLKNPAAMAAAFYMQSQLDRKKLSTALLADYSKKTFVPPQDLLRYYKLINA